ncbi:MAG: hypothetical protein KKF28_00685, partial [Proteobacteria bacterium]|nr:hypothetical protein [Pseudomonadota bacterium]
RQTSFGWKVLHLLCQQSWLSASHRNQVIFNEEVLPVACPMADNRRQELSLRGSGTIKNHLASNGCI